MNRKPILALIVAKPGPIRNSLFSLLTTLPQIGLVAESRDMASFLRLGSKFKPDLVVMEASLPDNHIEETIRYCKNDSFSSLTLVLVDDAGQKQEAESAGADAVLFKGIRAADLMNTLEELLASEPSAVSETQPFAAPLSN